MWGTTNHKSGNTKSERDEIFVVKCYAQFVTDMTACNHYGRSPVQEEYEYTVHLHTVWLPGPHDRGTKCYVVASFQRQNVFHRAEQGSGGLEMKEIGHRGSYSKLFI